MSLTDIHVVSVPVSDQDASRRFYADVLGFEVMRDNPFGDGARWIQLAPPRSGTSITLVTWFESAPPGSLQGVVLGTDDLDGDYERLVSRGLRFRGEIQDAPWGRFATFDDPDGNGWVLQQAASGSGA